MKHKQEMLHKLCKYEWMKFVAFGSACFCRNLNTFSLIPIADSAAIIQNGIRGLRSLVCICGIDSLSTYQLQVQTSLQLKMYFSIYTLCTNFVFCQKLWTKITPKINDTVGPQHYHFCLL